MSGYEDWVRPLRRDAVVPLLPCMSDRFDVAYLRYFDIFKGQSCYGGTVVLVVVLPSIPRKFTDTLR